MKPMALKAGVLMLAAAALATVFVYRDTYLEYLPASWRGNAGQGAGIPTGAPATQAASTGAGERIPAGTRQDPYVARGVIEEIEPELGRIVVAHGEIPGLMGAMTMGYPVTDDVRLDTLTVGETVELRLESVENRPDGNGIQVIAVTRDTMPDPAAAPAGQAMFTVDARRQQLIGVRTARVAYETFDRTVRTIGTVALDETRRSEVHSKIAGWIEETFVDFQYQHVQTGDPLFTLYSPELVATQEEYLLALRGMDALGASTFPTVAFGAEDLVRAARRRLELWDVTPEQIARLEEAREPFRTMTIHSPVSGHVMSRNAFPGQRVTPETLLYEIAEHSVVWVKVEVYENEIAWVREGQRAVMRAQALPGREFAGRVRFIDPHVNAQTRTMTVRLEFPNSDLALKPGMYADVELSASMGRRLMVPESAVLQTGVRNVVFVDHGEGRMEIRDVRIGTQVNDHYEVLGGLAEGERIVTSGNFLIDAESKLQTAEPVWQGEDPQ